MVLIQNVIQHIDCLLGFCCEAAASGEGGGGGGDQEPFKFGCQHFVPHNVDIFDSSFVVGR